MKNISEWLRRDHERVSNHILKPSKEINYAKAPEGALVTNRLSGRAEFGYCVFRRVGYRAHASSEALAKLDYWSQPLSNQRRKQMRHAWLKGVLWSPIYVEVSLEDDRFVINSIKDYDICLFMAERQTSVVLQVVETASKVGTKAKLELLRQGLHLRKGDKCDMLKVEVML